MYYWIYLIAAILFEIAGTTCLKLSQGFSKWIPSVLTFLNYAISFSCLGMALKGLEVGIAYAVWSGLGTAIIAILGVMVFQESISIMKIAGIFLIIAGVTVLNIYGNAH